ncbi:MAG: hypothetical protein WB500_15990 [Rhodoplanes sp.]
MADNFLVGQLERIDTPCISELSGQWDVHRKRFPLTQKALLHSCEGASFWMLEASMDETDQWKTTAVSPSTDDDHDALAKRWRENWASSVPGPRRMGGQVLQQLRHGRVRVVAVESTRSRRRPVSL